MLYSQQYENKNLKPNQNESIPCLYLKSPIKSNLLGLYFHGNGEDIYLSYHLLNQIRNDLKINVLAMEYSGYGIYKGNSSEQQIIDDAQEIMKYLTINLNIDTQNIIIIGRSIGTGIATLLASQYEFMALFLISPFTSLRAVVKHIAGGIAQYFIKDRFKNIEYISKVQCPIYIAHGKKDKMIPYSHSLELKEQCPNAQKCKVDLPNNMTHVEIDFQRDLIQPFKSFLNQHSFLFKCRIDYSHQKSSGTNIEFPQEVYYNL